MAQYRQDETDISLSMLLEVVDVRKGYGADVGHRWRLGSIPNPAEIRLKEHFVQV